MGALRAGGRNGARFHPMNHPASTNSMVRHWFGLPVAVLAILFLYGVARLQDRELFPKMHDESMHLVQMQMLARGRLWMPQHEVPDAFETFHVLVRPKYASIYFPGASLLYLPGIWLSLPHWLMPLLVSGASVGLLYSIVTEVTGRRMLGVLAAALLLSLSQFRYIALMTLSHPAMIFLGLAMIGSFLRWRAAKTLGWAAAVGLFAGWAAITRPLDALCYALPLGMAMLWHLRVETGRRQLATVVCIIAPAIPFLALQAVQNVGLTGDVLKTPYQLSAERYTPQVGLGFPSTGEPPRPQTDLPQWQTYHDRFTKKNLKAHRPDRLWRTWMHERFPRLIRHTAPHPLLFMLFAVGLASLRGPAWPLLAVIPLYLLAYVFFPYFQPHYLMVIAPLIVLGIVLGVQTLARLWPRAAPITRSVAAAAIVIACATSVWRVTTGAGDDPWVTPVLALNARLPEIVRRPAVVLFRYQPDSSPHEEPVYNVDVAWPDEAPIVRAHDLGSEPNLRLVHYYAAHQPGRHFYRVDRETGAIEYLGVASDLASSPANLATTRPLPPVDGL